MGKMFTPVAVLLVLVVLMVGCSNDPAPVQSTNTAEPALQLKPQIPSNAAIDSARFFIHVTDSTTQTVFLHKITTDWSETSVTWNSFNDNYLSDTVGSFMVTDTGWMSVDITDLAKQWFDTTSTNFGVVLMPGDEDTTIVTYDSREATANMPYLEICYTAPDGAQCEMFTATADAYIYETEADSNYGTVNELITGRDTADNSERWTLLRAEFPVTIPPAQVGGMVWDDANGNGIKDTGEVGIENITVDLYDCSGDTLLAMATTDTGGMYVFDSLMPGSYYLQITPPDSLALSPMVTGDTNQVVSTFDPATGKTECITVEAGMSYMDWNAGLFAANTGVGNFVWDDLNMNGLQDEGEPGMSDIVVRLYTCTDSLVDTTMTDSAGMYGFTRLLPGDYYLEFVNPPEYVFTMQDVGTNDSLDSDVNPETKRTDCFTLDQGQTDNTWDAGMYIPPTGVGDFVWDDLNMNGLQDEGEPGMADIVVRLYTCMDELVDTTMTDSVGMYQFTELDPGSYYLEFVNPFGYVFTLQDVGTNDSLDSDVGRYSKRTDCFTLALGQTDNTWDAGMYAWNGCTYGPGYWKNHAGGGPQCDEVTKLLPIWLGDEGGTKSVEISDAITAIKYLTPTAIYSPSNGIIKLYIKLLTAKLNIANFANPEAVYDTIVSVDHFLAMYDYNDWDSMSKDMRKQVLKWMGFLGSFNEGEIGPGSCDDHNDCGCGDDDGGWSGDYGDDGGHKKGRDNGRGYKGND